MSKFIQRFSSRDQRGFTLVELLVVIAIISILSTVLLLQLGGARAKGRDAARIAAVNQIRTASELFFDSNNAYPTTLTELVTAGYLSKLPTDPLSGANYNYAYSPASSPTKYQTWAELEQKNSNAFNNDSDINSTGWSGNTIDASNATTTEACSTSSNDCIFDLGQN